MHTMWTPLFVVCFVLNIPMVSFAALLSQTREHKDHLDPICYLNVIHYFIDHIISLISRLSQTVESLDLQSLLMWSHSVTAIFLVSLSAIDFWDQESYGICFVPYSIFIIPNTHLLFRNHHRALRLHFHKNTHNYSISFLTVTANPKLFTTYIKNHFFHLCCFTFLYSEFNLPFYYLMSQDLSYLQ